MSSCRAEASVVHNLFAPEYYRHALRHVGLQAIVGDKDGHQRVLESYRLMLDFYGMELRDVSSGEVVRAEHWKKRFQHLNK